MKKLFDALRDALNRGEDAVLVDLDLGKVEVEVVL